MPIIYRNAPENRHAGVLKQHLIMQLLSIDLGLRGSNFVCNPKATSLMYKMRSRWDSAKWLGRVNIIHDAIRSSEEVLKNIEVNQIKHSYLYHGQISILKFPYCFIRSATELPKTAWGPALWIQMVSDLHIATDLALYVINNDF